MSADPQTVTETAPVAALWTLEQASKVFLVGVEDQYKVPITQVKLENLAELGKRTTFHQQNNVVDSTITGWIRHDPECLGYKPEDYAKFTDARKAEVTKEIGAWRESHKDEVAKKRTELRNLQWERMTIGNFSIRTRGPAKDPVQVEVDARVLGTAMGLWSQFRDINNNGAEWPDNDDTVFTFKNGQTRTRVQILDAVRNNEAKMAEIRAAAEAAVLWCVPGASFVAVTTLLRAAYRKAGLEPRRGAKR